jgi:hypothetical protein
MCVKIEKNNAFLFRHEICRIEEWRDYFRSFYPALVQNCDVLPMGAGYLTKYPYEYSV